MNSGALTVTVFMIPLPTYLCMVSVKYTPFRDRKDVLPIDRKGLVPWYNLKSYPKSESVGPVHLGYVWKIMTTVTV